MATLRTVVLLGAHFRGVSPLARAEHAAADGEPRRLGARGRREHDACELGPGDPGKGCVVRVLVSAWSWLVIRSG